MAVKYFICGAVCFLLALAHVTANLEVVNGKIKITTVTTAGCGDTVSFINDQLVPAYSLYGEFLDLEFVPWGRTTRNEDGDGLVCQFGVNDCWANRLHRCVLNMLRDNQAAQLQYLACEFSSPYPSFLQGSYLCVQAMGLNLVDVDHCVVNSPLDDLDLAAEQASAGPMASTAIDFVPAIVFNDDINMDNHLQARSRLSSMICFALAAEPGTGITSCQI